MLKWGKGASPEVGRQAPSGGDGAFAALQTLSRSASQVGREAAAVRGALDDTERVLTAQGQALQGLAAQLHDIAKAQASIGAATAQSGAGVQRARRALSAVGEEVQSIAQTLATVSDAAADITKVSLQTRLVAFNASVEAKHAGEAGKGFGVVADAIKALAAQVESSSKAIVSAIATLQQRIDGFREQLAAPTGMESRPSEIHLAFQSVEADVQRIAASAQQGVSQVTALNERANELEREVHEAGHGLKVAIQGSDHFLKLSEEMIEQIAGCGVQVEDAEFIQLAQEAAAEISAMLEVSLRNRVIAEADLFDENYRPMSGTNPAQHYTAFCPLTDRLLPDVQERVVGSNSKIVFAIAADRNGYIATHNKRYCHPQKVDDVVWNTANSRYRRIFNDRTGLASARNTKPFLVQTYRRDMGGGNFVILKEVAAPITVNGRHWGGFRLAFNF